MSIIQIKNVNSTQIKIVIQHEQKKIQNRERIRGQGTRKFCRRQAKLSNFIYNKENPARICEDTMNEFFGLVTQVHTELFTNSIKDFYYICGVKFYKNGRNMKYSVNNFLKPTLSSPTKPDFEAGKTTLTKDQKRILEPKINC